MRTYLLKCDCCPKTVESPTVPESLYEFPYEYNGNKEVYYLVCSFKCYIQQLVNCLEWSKGHYGVLIAGMHPRFVRDLVKGVQREAREEFVPKRQFEISEEEIKAVKPPLKELGTASPIKYGGYTKEQLELLETCKSSREFKDKFFEMWPNTEKTDSQLRSYFYYANKKKVDTVGQDQRDGFANHEISD